MSNENEIHVTSELISEFYSPASMSDVNGELLCTLSRKIQYQHAADEEAAPTTFVTSFSLTAVMPEELGGDTKKGAFVLDCMTDALHLHHVAESVRKKFGTHAQKDGDLAVALQLVIRSIDQATKDMASLLEMASIHQVAGD